MQIRQANPHGHNAINSQARPSQEHAAFQQFTFKPPKSRMVLSLMVLVALSTGLSACHHSDPSARKVKPVPTYSQRPVTVTLDHAVFHDALPDKAMPLSTQTDPTLIVPGVRVGKITAHTTLADLKRLYGPANVMAGQVPGTKGTHMPGAIVFPHDAKKKLTLYWETDPKHTRNDSPTVESVLIQGRQSLWHTSEGIKIGTTLIELEHLNGGPFLMSGLGWAYGGMVLSWGNQGKLRDKFQKLGSLALQLAPPQNAHGGYELVEGEKTFSSGNEILQRLNPQVSSITAFLQ